MGTDDLPAMCLGAMGLLFSQICHSAELNTMIEATMPVNPYDDHTVILQWPHGRGDLNIVWAS